jgi:hypothetical protein
VIARAGRLPEARAQFEEEARQEPESPRARANLERIRRLQHEFAVVDEDARAYMHPAH